MKKIIFIIMAVAALGFASCGHSTENAVENDSTTVADTTVAVDSLVSDTTVA